MSDLINKSIRINKLKVNPMTTLSKYDLGNIKNIKQFSLKMLYLIKCIIIGIFQPYGQNNHILSDLIQTIKHRGPDNTGIWHNKNVSLGSTTKSS